MVYLNTESHFESFYNMYTVYSQHLFHYGGAPGSPLPPEGCSKEALCAAGQKGAPILFRACARRAAGDGVCRGSAVAAGRPPGGPPEAMVSPETRSTTIVE